MGTVLFPFIDQIHIRYLFVGLGRLDSLKLYCGCGLCTRRRRRLPIKQSSLQSGRASECERGLSVSQRDREVCLVRKCARRRNLARKVWMHVTTTIGILQHQGKSRSNKYRVHGISWVKGSVCFVLKFALPPSNMH